MSFIKGFANKSNGLCDEMENLLEYKTGAAKRFAVAINHADACRASRVPGTNPVTNLGTNIVAYCRNRSHIGPELGQFRR